MIRDSIRAALAAFVLWPLVPPRPAPPPVIAPPVAPVAWAPAPAYNPPPAPPPRLRRAIAAALDAVDRMAPF